MSPLVLRPVVVGLLVAAVTSALAGCATRVASADPAAPATVPGSPPELRVAAEWEPALGVLVRWPPYVPQALFEAIARDSKLYVLVDDDAAALDASSWFEAWGIDPGEVEFLVVPGSDDAAWTRDFGPHPIFTADGRLELGDARYDLSTPDSGLACDSELGTPWNGGWGIALPNYDVTKDDAAPTAIAGALGLPARELPFVLTGGNFLTDGRGGALSTCVLTNENRGNGLSDAEFFRLGERELGLERYELIPNFELDGIQHIDCLLKLLDEERLLVARAPRDHALYDLYESIVSDHLAHLRTATGRQYEIQRIDLARYAGEKLTAYTNSLILNDVVYVPLFDVPQDEVALETWRAALPGHRVHGIRFRLDEEAAIGPRVRRMYPDGLGWRNFDALHCRTRAVWDPGMLHLAVDRLPAVVEPGRAHTVAARIVPYSGAELLARSLRLHWRRHGETEWRAVPLERGDDGRFRAELPAQEHDAAVEYWLSAADTSGREERAPRTAPGEVYRTSVLRPATGPGAR